MTTLLIYTSLYFVTTHSYLIYIKQFSRKTFINFIDLNDVILRLK